MLAASYHAAWDRPTAKDSTGFIRPPPPWQYRNGSDYKSASGHYQYLYNEEILMAISKNNA